MEKIAERENKKALRKAETVGTIEPEVTFFDEKLGITFTLDNSIKKYANDPAILEQVAIANRKFSKEKS